MAPRLRRASVAIRRPAAARSQRVVRRGSGSSSAGRSRSRARSLVVQVAIDTNEFDYDACPVLMNMNDGGLMTLDASLFPLKRKERGGHHVYHLSIERSSDEEIDNSGIHGTIVRADAIAWMSRTQFRAVANRLGSPAVLIA